MVVIWLSFSGGGCSPPQCGPDGHDAGMIARPPAEASVNFTSAEENGSRAPENAERARSANRMPANTNMFAERNMPRRTCLRWRMNVYVHAAARRVIHTSIVPHLKRTRALSCAYCPRLRCGMSQFPLPQLPDRCPDSCEAILFPARSAHGSTLFARVRALFVSAPFHTARWHSN